MEEHVRKVSLEEMKGSGGAASLLTPSAIPLSIYLHWPWCIRKCPYCDFNSRRLPDDNDEMRYVTALLRDLSHWQPLAEARPITSIFIGGGTPSLMSGKAVSTLLDGVAKQFTLASDCEITLEANPGTTNARKFADFRKAGVNRLSIGVQSFSDERLKRLGRIHSADEARCAIREASRVFENFNLDLMFALPGETVEGLLQEVDEAAASGATHLSCYQLTIEPGTAFAKHVPADLPDEDLTADMGDALVERLAQAGFIRYEVSGYAKPGHRCRHNLNYWTYGDYLAAGAGAHGKITTKTGIFREVRIASPSRYLHLVEELGHGVASAHKVVEEDRPFEFMLNALRLVDGVPSALFEARTGLPLSCIHDRRVELEEKGLLDKNPALLRPTALGLQFLSDLQESFL